MISFHKAVSARLSAAIVCAVAILPAAQAGTLFSEPNLVVLKASGGSAENRLVRGETPPPTTLLPAVFEDELGDGIDAGAH